MLSEESFRARVWTESPVFERAEQSWHVVGLLFGGGGYADKLVFQHLTFRRHAGFVKCL